MDQVAGRLSLEPRLRDTLRDVVTTDEERQETGERQAGQGRGHRRENQEGRDSISFAAGLVPTAE